MSEHTCGDCGEEYVEERTSCRDCGLYLCPGCGAEGLCYRCEIRSEARSEFAAEIDRLRAELAACRASPPPAPAAIVDVWDLRTDGREVHAFALRSDAEAYVDGEPHGEERCITYTGGWTWHPAGTPGELEPDAAAPPGREEVT
jgi:hypothetical protein